MANNLYLGRKLKTSKLRAKLGNFFRKWKLEDGVYVRRFNFANILLVQFLCVFSFSIYLGFQFFTPDLMYSEVSEEEISEVIQSYLPYAAKEDKLQSDINQSSSPLLDTTNQNSKQIISEHNRLVIPKIDVNVEINEGDATALEIGAWHRFPDRGTPSIGNFILSAHRYSLRPTPLETYKASPFYHIDKLELGDILIVEWEQEVYFYKVNNKFEVEPTAIEIEAPSANHKLTLYTCKFGGNYDGRVVVEAIQIDPSELAVTGS